MPLLRNGSEHVCWLHGLSPEVKASIDGGVIHDHRVWIEEPPSGGFSFLQLASAMSQFGTFETCRLHWATSVFQRRPEVRDNRSKWREWPKTDLQYAQPFATYSEREECVSNSLSHVTPDSFGAPPFCPTRVYAGALSAGCQWRAMLRLANGTRSCACRWKH